MFLEQIFINLLSHILKKNWFINLYLNFKQLHSFNVESDLEIII